MRFNIFGMEVSIKKEYIVYAAIIAVMVTGFTLYRYLTDGSDLIIDTSADAGGKVNLSVKPAEREDDAKEQDGTDEIKVYVVGCVKNPGVVTLERGQIIQDAVEAAGGVTQDADTENINMAYRLVCNVMIRIRSKEEGITVTGSSQAGSGAGIIEDSGGAVEGTGSKDGKVNINTATSVQLQELPGIGVVTAQDIVVFRDKNGAFKDIRDIMKVPGIKEGRFAAIEDLITVE